jgi:hypothetical protein
VIRTNSRSTETINYCPTDYPIHSNSQTRPDATRPTSTTDYQPPTTNHRPEQPIHYRPDATRPDATRPTSTTDYQPPTRTTEALPKRRDATRRDATHLNHRLPTTDPNNRNTADTTRRDPTTKNIIKPDDIEIPHPDHRPPTRLTEPFRTTPNPRTKP